jgi:Holliday junction resolvase RusA-like endonuclease
MKGDTKSSCLEIVISGLKPRPKGRPRFVKAKIVNGRFIKGHAYTPASTRGYEKELAWHFRTACKEPWKGLIALEIQFCTASSGDADNLAKAVLDAGNKILFLDDSQVVRLTTEKIKSSDEEIHLVMRKVVQ